MLFSRVAAQMYSPIESTQRFLFSTSSSTLMLCCPLMLVGHQPGGVGPRLDCTSASPPHLVLAPPLRLHLGNLFSAGPQVILRDSYSVSRCNSHVPVGGGELRAFLLCHLDSDSLSPVV